MILCSHNYTDNENCTSIYINLCIKHYQCRGTLIDLVQIYIDLNMTLIRVFNHQTVNVYGLDMWRVGSTSTSEGEVSGYFHSLAALLPVKRPQYTYGMG
jgi:hypothetical protein